MSNTPALPDGFTLDVQDDTPALPEGFALDTPDNAPALPAGFSLDNTPATADVNPEGTALGRALKRGVLRTRSALPAIQAQKGATVLSDAALAQPDLIRNVFLETTRLPDVPEGVDISTPELASAAITGLGYPADFANVFRQTFDIRARDAAAALGSEAEVAQTAIGNVQAAQELNDRAAAIPNSPSAEQFKQILNAAPDTTLDVLKAYAQNPGTALAFLGETAAESLPQMGASAVTTLATRSPALGAAVLGGGTVVQEFGSGVNEFFAEHGVSPKTPEEAAALIRDPELMAAASRRGVGRGVVIALAEMAGPRPTENPVAPAASDLETPPVDVETQPVDVEPPAAEPVTAQDPDGELDVSEGIVAPYDGDAAGRDPEYSSRRENAMAQAVDDAAQTLGVESTLTAAGRREIIADLTQNGGPVEDAITGHIQRDADVHEGAAAGGTTDAAADVPAGPGPVPGETQRVSAAPADAGRAGQRAPETADTDVNPEAEAPAQPATPTDERLAVFNERVASVLPQTKENETARRELGNGAFVERRQSNGFVTVGWGEGTDGSTRFRASFEPKPDGSLGLWSLQDDGNYVVSPSDKSDPERTTFWQSGTTPTS